MNPSTAMLDHFDHPRGAGEFAPGEPGVSTGEAGEAAQGVVLRLQVKVGEAGRIEAARFKALGCTATIACASLVTEWLPERTAEEAYNAEVRRLVTALEIPAERMYAPLIVEDALRAALKEVVEPCQ